MKKRRFVVVFAFVIMFVLSLGVFKVASTERVRAKEQSDFYWSELNAPVFYGAIGAKISKNVDFSTSDPRFRIFVRDFEDGDLKPKIEENNVLSGVPGTYHVV